MSQINHNERLEFLRREAECHFENLKEASKNGIKPAAFNKFKSSIKQCTRSIDAIEKDLYVENFGTFWKSNLRSQKHKVWEDKWVIQRIKRIG